MLRERCARILWHIHELPYALDLILGKQRGSHVLAHADRFIAVSSVVSRALVSGYGLPLNRIDMVHGFVTKSHRETTQRDEIRRRILSLLGWSEDSFVIGGCGELGWRKGTDLFLQLARLCRDQGNNQELRFLWVGGSDSDIEALQFAHDAKIFNLQPICRHVQSTENVSDFYCAMDVFALTSREDPYPLVMLEAGIEGVPTVCFDEAGGAPEFVGTDAGLVVPYLDVQAFAHSVMSLRNDLEQRQRMGEAARTRVVTQLTVEQQAPKLLESIERTISER